MNTKQKITLTGLRLIETYNSKVSWNNKGFQKFIGVSSILIVFALNHVMRFYERLPMSEQLFAPGAIVLLMIAYLAIPVFCLFVEEEDYLIDDDHVQLDG